ncbi:hypothetical protein EDD37DRAFT_157671 [Exophiala viscosa]|uniref:Uncharacterized protein n=1 Tax=Exophiala viscosa TaxID=2486360 RepID=A0AAN6DQN5_9EURO|nr:hypothetical protein EDD36DRAFT_71448 [Exophiala viscosa]KAI1620515.1 hypothetical protein EDD37DRAFT_157671 [Exophiala viscosa]
MHQRRVITWRRDFQLRGLLIIHLLTLSHANFLDLVLHLHYHCDPTVNDNVFSQASTLQSILERSAPRDRQQTHVQTTTAE